MPIKLWQSAPQTHIHSTQPSVSVAHHTPDTSTQHTHSLQQWYVSVSIKKHANLFTYKLTSSAKPCGKVKWCVTIPVLNIYPCLALEQFADCEDLPLDAVLGCKVQGRVAVDILFVHIDTVHEEDVNDLTLAMPCSHV